MGDLSPRCRRRPIGIPARHSRFARLYGQLLHNRNHVAQASIAGKLGKRYASLMLSGFKNVSFGGRSALQINLSFRERVCFGPLVSLKVFRDIFEGIVLHL